MQTPLLRCSLEKSKTFEYKLDIDDIKKLLILLCLVKTIPFFKEMITLFDDVGMKWYAWYLL